MALKDNHILRAAGHAFSAAISSAGDACSSLLGESPHNRNRQRQNDPGGLPPASSGPALQHEPESTGDDFDRRQAENELIRFELGIERSGEIIFMTDVEGKITYVNPAFEKTYGYSREEAIGKTPRVLKSGVVPGETYRRLWGELLARRIVSGEMVNRTRDGRLIHVDSSTSPLTGRDGEILGFLAIQRDITERKRAEAALRESEERFRRLAENARDIIYRYEFLPAPRLSYISPSVQHLLGYSVEEYLADPALVFDTVHPEDRHILVSLMEGTIPSQPVLARWQQKYGHEFWMEHRITPIYSAGHLVAIEGIARDVTARVRAENALKEGLDRTMRAVEGAIRAMATLTEMRDPYTAGHQRNVSKLGQGIGLEMGLSEKEVEGIRVAGLIHDIGKITAPIEILAKPGPISGAELSIIKDHPLAGYEILKGIEFPWPVAELVVQHHERMDGSGYPAGISGEEILLGARVLAVADVVESMSSHRPYRPSLGVDSALEEIERQKGQLYDSEVVDACATLFTAKRFTFD